MNALLYIRVSTAGQAESGLGAEMQEAACRALCGLRSWTVAGVYTDPAVGGREEIERREGLQALLRDYAARPEGSCVVVVYDVKRLARSQRILWTLLDDRGQHRIVLSSATEPFDTSTPIGRAMLGMLGVWAQLDWEQIRERNIAMQRAAKARGARWGAPKCYERREKDPATGKVAYVVDPVLVERVRTVQERYRSGDYSLVELAKWLNEHGVPSPRGRKWHGRTVDVAVKTKLPHDCRADPRSCPVEHQM